jgi:hypothetical protein
MPTFRHGKNTRVYLNGYDMSPFLNEATSTFSQETAETTTFTQNDKTYIAGLADGTVSASGLFDGTANASNAILTGRLKTEDNVFTIMPDGTAIGAAAILASGQITSYEVTSPVADVVSLSTEIQADGGLFPGGIVLCNGVTASASANGTNVDNTVLTSQGAVANLHVTANNRNGTAVIKVQHSVDNSAWVDLITFSSVSASTVVGESVSCTGTVNRHLRYQLSSIGGASGSVTFTVAAARK